MDTVSHLSTIAKKIKKDNILNVAKTHYVNGDGTDFVYAFFKRKGNEHVKSS